jgi:integrase
MRERRKGYWELAVDAGRDPATGRRRRVVRGFRGTKREAQRALNELLVSVDGGHTTASTATLAQLLRDWLENVGPSLSPTTLAGYRRLVDGYIVPALGKIKLHQLTAAHLDAYYRSLSKGGLKPATVRQFHAVISSALNQGVKWDWVGANVAARATPPPVRRTKLDPPTPADVIRLIEAAKCSRSPELGVFLHLAAVTGARRGELVALRWSAVDLVAAQVLIEHSIVQVGRELFEKDTKTHQARRLSLDPGTVDLLARFKSAAEDLLVPFGVALSEDAFIFSDEPDGSKPWNPERITRAFSWFCAQEGITGVRFHDLRHFAATRLLSAGVDVRTVSGRLGHANAATTLGVYAHFLESSDQAAAVILGDLLTPSRNTAHAP